MSSPKVLGAELRASILMTSSSPPFSSSFFSSSVVSSFLTSSSSLPQPLSILSSEQALSAVSSLTSSVTSSLVSSGVLPSSTASTTSSFTSSLTSSMTSSLLVFIFSNAAATASSMSLISSSLSIVSMSCFVSCSKSSLSSPISTGAEFTIGSILPACDGLLVSATDVISIGSLVSLFKYQLGLSHLNTRFSMSDFPMLVHEILPKRPFPGTNFRPDSQPFASVFPPVSD